MQLVCTQEVIDHGLDRNRLGCSGPASVRSDTKSAQVLQICL
jgi:hypothetical protein